MVQIPDEPNRITYSGQTGTGPFAFSFRVFAKEDLIVYVDGADVGQGGFSFAGIANSEAGFDGGSVTLSASVSNATVTIARKIIAKRTEDLSAGPLDINDLNTEFDRNTAQIQDVQKAIDRTIQLHPDDTAPAGGFTIPAKDDRASRVLAFGSDGEPITGPLVVDVEALSDQAGAIAALSTLTDEIDLVADNIAGIGIVGTDLLLGANSLVKRVGDDLVLGEDSVVKNVADDLALGASSLIAQSLTASVGAGQARDAALAAQAAAEAAEANAAASETAADASETNALASQIAAGANAAEVSARILGSYADAAAAVAANPFCLVPSVYKNTTDGYMHFITSKSPAASTALQDAAGAIAALVDSAPATLDTLNELAAALGDDPNFATTVTNALAAKAPLASPALTGTPTAPTATPGDNSTQIATTAFVTANTVPSANPTFTGDVTVSQKMSLTPQSSDPSLAEGEVAFLDATAADAATDFKAKGVYFNVGGYLKKAWHAGFCDIVEHFGCVGDNSVENDCTQGIRDAWAAAKAIGHKAVYIPPAIGGGYLISGYALNVDVDEAMIFGVGEASVIRATHDGAALTIDASTGANRQRVHIRDLHFVNDHNSGANSVGIDILTNPASAFGLVHSRLEGLWFRRFGLANVRFGDTAELASLPGSGVGEHEFVEIYGQKDPNTDRYPDYSIYFVRRGGSTINIQSSMLRAKNATEAGGDTTKGHCIKAGANTAGVGFGDFNVTGVQFTRGRSAAFIEGPPLGGGEYTAGISFVGCDFDGLSDYLYRFHRLDNPRVLACSNQVGVGADLVDCNFDRGFMLDRDDLQFWGCEFLGTETRGRHPDYALRFSNYDNAAPEIRAQRYNLSAGGTQDLRLACSGAGYIVLGNHRANYLGVQAELAGSHPVLEALGSDANINVVIKPKGAGRVVMGDASQRIIKNVELGSDIQLDAATLSTVFSESTVFPVDGLYWIGANIAFRHLKAAGIQYEGRVTLDGSIIDHNMVEAMPVAGSSDDFPLYMGRFHYITAGTKTVEVVARQVVDPTSDDGKVIANSASRQATYLQVVRVA